MTRNKKNAWSSGGPTGPARDRKGRPLSADLQAHIGVRLKALYDSVLSEPIPDRFSELLDRLDGAAPAGEPAASPRPAPSRETDDPKAKTQAPLTASGEPDIRQ